MRLVLIESFGTIDTLDFSYLLFFFIVRYHKDLNQKCIDSTNFSHFSDFFIEENDQYQNDSNKRYIFNCIIISWNRQRNINK